MMITIVFSGCSQQNKSANQNDNVHLCDYNNLVINEDEYCVSEEDLNTAIEMNLNSIETDCDNIQLTDETARQYFNTENKKAAVTNIKREIVENRFCEAAIEVILTNSYVTSLPEESEKFIERVISSQKLTADENKIEYDKYFQNNFNMSEKEYRESILDEYVNYMILSTLAQKEGYIISDAERSEIVSKIASDNDMSADDIIEMYGNEYIDFILYENFLKNYLIDIYSKQIEKAI